MGLISELRRRNVFRMAVLYVVVAWLIMQVAEVIITLAGLPPWSGQLVLALLAIGFPFALIFSWLYELTPEGISLERDVEVAESITHVTGRRIDFIVISLMCAALILFAYDKWWPQVQTQKSVAVLPFVNMSSDPEQQYFADGVTEEILNMLAKIPELRVTARTSSFFFKDKNMQVSDIATALNVTHVLEGSVRRDGNQVRITAQLIEAHSDSHLWSETYDRELEGIFAIQDDVASAIAATMLDSFAGLNVRPVDRSDNVAAFEAYRTGRLRWWRRSPTELEKAIELFDQAIEHDPQFAPAYAAKADSLVLLSLYANIPSSEAVERASPLIVKALKIDPDSAEAHAALGLMKWQQGQEDAAEASLREAVSLNGDYIPARLWLGGLLGDLGRIPEQGKVLEEAMFLDPLNEMLAINYAGNLHSQGNSSGATQLLAGLIKLRPDSANLLRLASGFAMYAGSLVESWDYAKRAFDIGPESPANIRALAGAWMLLGEPEESEKLLVAGLVTSPNNMALKSSYSLLLIMGSRFDEAEENVKQQFGENIGELPDYMQQGYYDFMGLIYLSRGESDAALTAFEKSTDAAATGIPLAEVRSLTMAAKLHDSNGNLEEAEQRLLRAERLLRRARTNGQDDATIYYAECVVFALRGDIQPSLRSLRQAYDRGFRESWVLASDIRLESIHDRPEFLSINRQIDEDVESARLEVHSRLSATG